MGSKEVVKQLLKNNKKTRNFLAIAYYYLNKNAKRLRGKNNTVNHSGAFLAKVKFDIKGDSNEVIIHEGARISNTKIFIRGNNNKLIIGKECGIGGGKFSFENNGSVILIGEKTTILKALIANTESNSKIEIGEDCMLSAGIEIRTGDSHPIFDLKTKERINYPKDVYIGDHVWVGAFVRILKGAKINNNSVIGMNSLVTREIPNNCSAAGSPAKPIKTNITWSR